MNELFIGLPRRESPLFNTKVIHNFRNSTPPTKYGRLHSDPNLYESDDIIWFMDTFSQIHKYSDPSKDLLTNRPVSSAYNNAINLKLGNRPKSTIKSLMKKRPARQTSFSAETKKSLNETVEVALLKKEQQETTPPIIPTQKSRTPPKNSDLGIKKSIKSATSSVVTPPITIDMPLINYKVNKNVESKISNIESNISLKINGNTKKSTSIIKDVQPKPQKKGSGITLNDYSILQNYEKKIVESDNYLFPDPLCSYNKFKSNALKGGKISSNDAFFTLVLEMERLEYATVRYENRELKTTKTKKISNNNLSVSSEELEPPTLIKKILSQQNKEKNIPALENKLSDLSTHSNKFYSADTLERLTSELQDLDIMPPDVKSFETTDALPPLQIIKNRNEEVRVKSADCLTRILPLQLEDDIELVNKEDVCNTVIEKTTCKNNLIKKSKVCQKKKYPTAACKKKRKVKQLSSTSIRFFNEEKLGDFDAEAENNGKNSLKQAQIDFFTSLNDDNSTKSFTVSYTDMQSTEGESDFDLLSNHCTQSFNPSLESLFQVSKDSDKMYAVAAEGVKGSESIGRISRKRKPLKRKYNVPQTICAELKKINFFSLKENLIASDEWTQEKPSYVKNRTNFDTQLIQKLNRKKVKKLTVSKKKKIKRGNCK
ncbi:hypothetical protein HDU92_004765 [Lobulomyces angularis]|nr:hypothetical protein HDU92_004765 [Lobulomyces angularis]